MATIPLGWRMRALHHSSAAPHAAAVVVVAASAAAPLKNSPTIRFKEFAEFRRCITRSRQRRRHLLHARWDSNRERAAQDFGIVAGNGEWKVTGRRSRDGRILSRRMGVRGQAQDEQSGQSGEGAEELDFDISRLEDYTERVQSEVLCINAVVEDEEDQVIVFKGFSSSLIRATPNDQSEPLLPPTSVIVGIDRIRGPYRPSAPQYIQRGMSWRDFQTFLEEQGL